MAKTALRQTVCTVVLLAAAPVFAQTNMPGGHGTMPNGTMAPAERTGSPNRPMGGMTSHAMMDNHPAHRAAMDSMQGRSEASQDKAVDQLNEKSYLAARSGQAFGSTTSATGSVAVTTPNGAPRMNDMQPGSRPAPGRGGDGGSGGGSGM